MDDPPRVIDLAIELGSGAGAWVSYGDPPTLTFGSPAAADREALIAALEALAAELPDLAFTSDELQIVLHGTSEVQLDQAVDRLRGEFGLPVSAGQPQVAYREAITRTVEHDYTHKKRTEAGGQFARIKFRVEPNEPGQGIAFASEVVGGNVPEEFIPAVQKGVESILGSGPRIGFAMVDVSFVLTDGAYHDRDSSPLAFEIAARTGFREAIDKAGLVILEPVMWLEVTTPEEFIGDVIGDINARRGQIRGTEALDEDQLVQAAVPLSLLIGYANSLRALTAGRGRCAMRFSHYEHVPPSGTDPDDRFPPAAAMRA